jgi:predicted oxidoreductase
MAFHACPKTYAYIHINIYTCINIVVFDSCMHLHIHSYVYSILKCLTHVYIDDNYTIRLNIAMNKLNGTGNASKYDQQVILWFYGHPNSYLMVFRRVYYWDRK